MASPMIRLAGSGALLAALVLGAAKVGQGRLELGALVSFLLYTLYLLSPLDAVLQGTLAIRRAEGAVQRISEVLDIPIEAETSKTGRTLVPDPDSPALVLNSVSFSYPGRSPLLRNIDLVIERGGRAAVVGPSGIGKSTLLALICNFYQPSTGRISIAGHDVGDVQQAARQLVGLVEQDSPMLSGSVRDNLFMTSPQADDERLLEVLRQVGMADVVASLPCGIDSEIGEHGQRLSGGQRQRLAMARALLGKPSLLLLDQCR